MSIPQLAIVAEKLGDVQPLTKRGSKFFRIVQASTGISRVGYMEKIHFSEGDDDVLRSHVALLVGTQAMRACGAFTRPWPFLWVRQKDRRYAYVPPFGHIYKDPLFLRTAQLFYKELAAEFALV